MSHKNATGLQVESGPRRGRSSTGSVSLMLRMTLLSLVLMLAGFAQAEPGSPGSLGDLASKADRRVYPNAESVEPSPVGSRVPSAEVRDLDGGSFDLARLVKESGALLVFYRGGW